MPSCFEGPGTEVVTGIILTMAGQVVNVSKAPLVVVPVVVPAVPVGSPTLSVGRNVKVSPSVVTTSVVLKPGGTGKVNLSQYRVPEEEVTNTPPGKVSVDTPVCIGFGGTVGRNVKVSPSVVTTAVVLKPVGTGTVNLPQNKVPEAEVTITPPGKVSVDTPDTSGT